MFCLTTSLQPVRRQTPIGCKFEDAELQADIGCPLFSDRHSPVLSSRHRQVNIPSFRPASSPYGAQGPVIPPVVPGGEHGVPFIPHLDTGPVIPQNMPPPFMPGQQGTVLFQPAPVIPQFPQQPMGMPMPQPMGMPQPYGPDVVQPFIPPRFSDRQSPIVVDPTIVQVPATESSGSSGSPEERRGRSSRRRHDHSRTPSDSRSRTRSSSSSGTRQIVVEHVGSQAPQMAPPPIVVGSEGTTLPMQPMGMPMQPMQQAPQPIIINTTQPPPPQQVAMIPPTTGSYLPAGSIAPPPMPIVVPGSAYTHSRRHSRSRSRSSSSGRGRSHRRRDHSRSRSRSPVVIRTESRRDRSPTQPQQPTVIIQQPGQPQQPMPIGMPMTGTMPGSMYGVPPVVVQSRRSSSSRSRRHRRRSRSRSPQQPAGPQIIMPGGTAGMMPGMMPTVAPDATHLCSRGSVTVAFAFPNAVSSRPGARVVVAHLRQ
ncbi:hypothetical protein MKEN_01351900 [Mycena kentingensis (nom. inval.)]|nr:hypothetical protein MKEN_01351900 [Mycena kentingensis (nom. inval.)]